MAQNAGVQQQETRARLGKCTKSEAKRLEARGGRHSFESHT